METTACYLEISIDGTLYKPFFANHRLRRYMNTMNAVNGASHLIRNKNANLKNIRVVRAYDKRIMALLSFNNDKYNLKYLKDKVYSSVYCNVSVEEKDTLPIECFLDKENVADKDTLEDTSNSHNDSSTVLDFSTVKEISRDKCGHDALDTDKVLCSNDVFEPSAKELPNNIPTYNSINNFSKITIKDDSFFSELMSIAMEIAIRQRDPKQILKTELMISEKGYSWYVDDANKVQVAKTDDVVNLLYNGEIKV